MPRIKFKIQTRKEITANKWSTFGAAALTVKYWIWFCIYVCVRVCV